MIRPGLVSITFRKLTPQDVVQLAARAGLEGIEWGGDIHVPHGDVAIARQTGKITRDAGLEVAAYGSYYRLGTDDGPLFPAVLDSAVALGADKIRVWAGNASADADEAFHKLKAIYKAAGAENNCKLVVGNGGHRFYADDAWPKMQKYMAAGRRK